MIVCEMRSLLVNYDFCLYSSNVAIAVRFRGVGGWGLGIGDWGLGIGDWGLGIG
ncbi:hypothetical protein H6G35_30985 [Aulosira sp. FACHB-113]|uniref:hypothetical protein n=1 Tax=Tolypothrix tenuis TaxID=457083 RepID=UPI001686A243|nr:hypothetical protein [Aulosira sp. FACHB-113]